MQLKGKKILLISPNEWGKMFISKHHYAIELARLGNDVFFLNPPNYAQKKYIKIEKHNTISNLNIITYRPFLPFFLRFHARRAYDFLLRFELRYLRRSFKLPMDIVWCFETNLYSNLTYFDAKERTIFHPVDQVKYDYQTKIGEHADIILSVSKSILDKFSKAKTKKEWINHGLGADFVQMALQQDLRTPERSGPLKVGYVGNLLNSTIDKKTILRLVATFPSVEFHFIGPTEISHSNVGGHHGAVDFVESLKRFKNVKLLGVMSTSELVAYMPSMDLFLLSYTTLEGQYDRSNSHKLLEYLSTGKVIVSNYITSYENHRDLIQMLNGDEEEELIQLFAQTIENLPYFNSYELKKKRIEFAVDNSYLKQIQRIERLL